MFAGWLCQGLQWNYCWSFLHPTSWKSFAILGKKPLSSNFLKFTHKQKFNGATDVFFLATSNWCCHFPKPKKYSKSTSAPSQKLWKSLTPPINHLRSMLQHYQGIHITIQRCHLRQQSHLPLGWNFTSVENVEMSGKNMPLFPEATCIFFSHVMTFLKYLWFPSCWVSVPSFSTCIIWKNSLLVAVPITNRFWLTTWKGSKSSINSVCSRQRHPVSVR